ncbi:hypothetical protein CF65_02813 [Aggregatibacter actinomycetemcomitans HK1651]|nr:hypothetical protein CF65_02813 [Aggregatibacter actinomycetemcomitans HK1651]
MDYNKKSLSYFGHSLLGIKNTEKMHRTFRGDANEKIIFTRINPVFFERLYAYGFNRQW